ncbi:agamous-like MADS-box protein AGL80 [Nymphaea colorata]|nr:agamous-like MADS-box protein AGL80 [Nymphaea colorata]
MKRKKETLAYIAKDSVRKATFKKRKQGLLKKLSELSILCGVIACAIIFGRNDMLPEIWPNIEKAQQGIRKFKELIEVDQIKLLMNAEGFLQERIEKLKKQHAKMSKKNLDLELTLRLVESMYNKELLLEASIEDVRALSRVVATKHAMVQARLELQWPSSAQTLSPQPLVQAPPLMQQINEHRSAATNEREKEQFRLLESFLNSSENDLPDWPLYSSIHVRGRANAIHEQSHL